MRTVDAEVQGCAVGCLVHLGDRLVKRLPAWETAVGLDRERDDHWYAFGDCCADDSDRLARVCRCQHGDSVGPSGHERLDLRPVVPLSKVGLEELRWLV